MTASTTHLPVFSHAEQAGWEGFSHGNHWFQIGVVSVVVRGWGGRGVAEGWRGVTGREASVCSMLCVNEETFFVTKSLKHCVFFCFFLFTSPFQWELPRHAASQFAHHRKYMLVCVAHLTHCAITVITVIVVPVWFPSKIVSGLLHFFFKTRLYCSTLHSVGLQ